MPEVYAQALYTEAHKEGADAKSLVENLAKHLKATGREKLLPSILRHLQRIEQKHAKLLPTVEVAHERDAEKALKEAGQHGIHASRAHVNHQLISGWRATEKGRLVDHSSKNALITLYRKIVTP